MVLDATDYEALDVEVVQAALGPLEERFVFHVLPECDSTNSRLMALPADGDSRLAVLATDRQTAGRGRRGRNWLSWPGAGLTFSVRWKFVPARQGDETLGAWVQVPIIFSLKN